MKGQLLTIVLAIFFAALQPGCAHNPYASTNRVYKKQAKEFSKLIRQYPLQDSVGDVAGFVGTTNFSMRRPNYVIIHHTAQNSCEQTLKTFTLPRTQVSSHYVICKDGTVHHMLNDLLRGHHAGVSKWGNATDLNSSSIGIEMDNNGFEEFTDSQINSLLGVLHRLKKAFNIPVANFIGHADIAPGRKVDPNRNFPWQKLSEQGFGYWYDTTNVQVSSDFNAMQALRVIGYNIKVDTSAIQSFKLHFVPSDSSTVITDTDKKILADLVKKYQ
jgi:N-acetylmuramoyl-L-alanine amidase